MENREEWLGGWVKMNLPNKSGREWSSCARPLLQSGMID